MINSLKIIWRKIIQDAGAVGSSKIRPYESQGDSDLPICEICFQTDEAKYVQTFCCTATGRLGAIIIPHTYHRNCLTRWKKDHQFYGKRTFRCLFCAKPINKIEPPSKEDLSIITLRL